MLTSTTKPSHRPQYPGEIELGLGCGSGDYFVTSKPYSLNIDVQHWDRDRDLTPARAVSGSWELLTREGEPVLLHLVVPGGKVMTPAYLEEARPDLIRLTGAALGAELQSHLGALLRRFRSGDGYLTQWLCFDDQAQYNDLTAALYAHAGDAAREKVLRGLLKPWNGDYDKQMAWYRAHGPSRVETRADYDAEVAEFEALAAASRAALEQELR